MHAAPVSISRNLSPRRPHAASNHSTLSLSAGIFVFGGAAGTIEANEVIGSGGAGIRIDDSAPQLLANIVANGADVGIAVSGRAIAASGSVAAPLATRLGSSVGVSDMGVMARAATLPDSSPASVAAAAAAALDEEWWDTEAHVRTAVGKALTNGRQLAADAMPTKNSVQLQVPKGHKTGAKLQLRLRNGQVRGRKSNQRRALCAR